MLLRLKELRNERGIKQKFAADYLRVAPQTLSRWEREDGLPDAEQMKKLAELFHVKVDDLYDETNS